MQSEFIVRGPKPDLYKPLFINPEFPISQTVVGHFDGGKELIYDQYGGVPEAYLGAWPYEYHGYIGKNSEGVYGDGLLNEYPDNIFNQWLEIQSKILDIQNLGKQGYHFNEQEKRILEKELGTLILMAKDLEGDRIYGGASTIDLNKELKRLYMRTNKLIDLIQNSNNKKINQKKRAKLIKEYNSNVKKITNILKELGYRGKGIYGGTKDKPYCGIEKLRKGQKKGTLKECVKSKQIRQYGLKKVDKNLVNKLKNKDVNIKNVKLEFFKLSGKMNKLKKELQNAKLTKNERNKKLKELEEVTKQFKNIQKSLSGNKPIKISETNKKIIDDIEKNFDKLGEKLNLTADEFVKLKKRHREILKQLKKNELMKIKKKIMNKNKMKAPLKNKKQIIEDLENDFDILADKINQTSYDYITLKKKHRENLKQIKKPNLIQKLEKQLDELKEQKNRLEEELEDNEDEDNDLLEEDIENLTFDIDDLEGKIYNLKLQQLLKK